MSITATSLKEQLSNVFKTIPAIITIDLRILFVSIVIGACLNFHIYQMQKNKEKDEIQRILVIYSNNTIKIINEFIDIGESTHGEHFFEKLKNNYHNQIFVPSSKNNSELLKKVINLNDVIFSLLSDNINYLVEANSIIISKSGEIDKKSCSYQSYYLNDDIFLSVYLGLKKTSFLYQEIEYRINSNIISYSLYLWMFNLLICWTLSITSRSYTLLKRNQSLLDKTKKFYTIHKKFIIDCYNLTSQDNNEYFPLHVNMQDKQSNMVVSKLSIEEFRDFMQCYINGFSAITGTKLVLEYHFNDQYIETTFTDVELRQIVFSLFINLVHFTVSSKLSNIINVVINKDTFKCTCYGFKLQKDLLIKYSKKIFIETVNPYVLNLEQIFMLFETLQIENSVSVFDEKTVVQISFKSENCYQNTANSNVPVCLTKYRNSIITPR